MQIAYYTADVFTEQTFGGAQIAVLPDASQLNESQMQNVAREFNLSATVFVLPAERQDSSPQRFRLRVFSPHQEIEFGSHSTVAAAYILAEIGDVRLEQEHTPVLFLHGEEELPVYISHRQGRPVFVQFSLNTEPVVDNYVPDNRELSSCLSLPYSALESHNFQSLLVSNKGMYLIVSVAGLTQLREAHFKLKAWSQSQGPSTLAQSILLFCSETESRQADFHLRLLGPRIGAHEDPPVGSTIPAFSAYLCAHRHIQQGTYSYVAERGVLSERHSLIEVEMDNRSRDQLTLRVGGRAVMVCEGRFTFN